MYASRMRFRVADLDNSKFTDVYRVNAVKIWTRNISRRLNIRRLIVYYLIMYTKSSSIESGAIHTHARTHTPVIR